MVWYEERAMSEGNYIQFGVEGVPYSAVRVEIGMNPEGDDASIAEAVRLARVLADAYREEFYRPFEETPEEVQRVPLEEEFAPSAPPPQQRFRPAPTGAPRPPTPSKHSGLFCPEHALIELVESAAQYQEYDDGPNGEKVPAKFFCPGRENGTGRNHSVWRSRALSAVPARA